MKNILFCITVISFSQFGSACDYLVGKWNCTFSNGDKSEIEITDGNGVLLRQTKMGVVLGPLLIDGKPHTHIDSTRVKMNYQGICQSEYELMLDVEQVYMGGFKVRFDEHFIVNENKEMKLTVTDRKPGRAPTSKSTVCSKTE